MRLEGIDLLRGIAVVCVLIYHFFALMHIETHSFFPFVRYFGVLGVSLFFIISGFLIFRSINSNLQRFGWKSALSLYGLHRFFRIVPAYYVNFLVVLMLAPLTIDASYLFSHGFLKQIAAHLSFSAFFIYRDSGLGINGAYWTLNIEMLWYLLAPLLLLLFRQTKYYLILALLSLAYLFWIDSGSFTSPIDNRDIYAQYLSFQLPGQLVYFIAGILIYRKAASLMQSYPASVRLLFVASLLGVYMYTSSQTWMIESGFVVRNLFILFISALLFLLLYPTHIKVLHPLAWIGKISYSLYLWHMPVLFMLHYADVSHYLSTMQIASVFGIFVLIISAVSYYTVEETGFRWRRAVEAHLKGSTSNAR